jgi:Tc toxin complex TcA C-terminal TcB-binding domain/Neuraminidase-like domain/Salmonella virulence plasmid 28.1kDa A protein
MNMITFPLTPGMQGPTVGDLQDALQILGKKSLDGVTPAPYRPLDSPNSPTRPQLEALIETLRVEHAQSLYGEATQRLVLYFQLQNSLGDNLRGVVEERTAAKMNEWLREFGALDGDTVFIVRGQVRLADGSPFVDALVQAFDRDMRSEQFLGSAPLQEGHYEIRYYRSQFVKAEKEQADLVVKVLDAAGVELHKTPIQYNVPDEVEVNIVLQGGEYKGPSEFEVLTNILMPLLESISPIDLREDDQYQDISFLAGESRRSQLVISMWVFCHRLADKTAREETPLEPAVFFGFMRQGQPAWLSDSLLQEVKHPERIAILEERFLRDIATIGSELQQSLLQKAIADNLIPARTITKLKEILTILRQVELRFGAATTYGTGKGTISQLLALTPAARQAQTAFMAAFTDHSGPINEFWHKLASDNVLAEETVREVKLTFELGMLTRNHIPLVGELKMMFQRGEVQAKRELATYGRENWKEVLKRPGPEGTPVGTPVNTDGDDDDAKLDQYAFILEQSFARSYPTTSFAANLRRAESSPVSAKADVVRFIENNSTFHLDRYRVDHYIGQNENALQGIENKAALLTDLKSIQRVFKLNPSYKSVDALLARKIDSSQQIYFMGPEQFLTVLDGSGMNKIERKKLYRKAESTYGAALVLFGEYNLALNGVMPYAVPPSISDRETQAKIATLPNLQTLFGSQDYCECRYCRSVYSPAAYFVDVMRFLGERGTQGSTINAGKNVREILLERRPDLGEIELSCENTNTPLPYIDLVNEILEDTVAPPNPVTLSNAIGIDLVAGAIKLSVLKELIIKNVVIGVDAQVYARDSRGEWAIRDSQHAYKVFNYGGALGLLPTRQTFLSAAELRANPEYTNQDAYLKLKQEVFPLNLPFDLWHLQTRAYLNHLGVQQPRLLELFQQRLTDDVTLAPSDLQIDCAWLGLTETERKILTGALWGNQPWKFWGLTKVGNDIPDPENPSSRISGRWNDVLKQVNVLLHRSGLAYKELLQLLSMKYVNPDGSIFIFDTADPNAANCDTSLFTIEHLTEDALTRMHRFIRLWRKLSCTMWELDLLLPDTNPAPNVIDKQITDGALQDISNMNRLREQTGLDWRAIYSLYNGIDHNVYVDFAQDGAPAVQTLYQRLFRNKLVDAVGSFPSSPDQIGGTVQAGVPSILAALRIKEIDLNLILSDLTMTVADALDKTVLSHIYRVTALAAALKLRIDEFLRLKRLWAQDPFADPGATRKFVELAQQVSASNFSVLELDYLLAHRFTPNSGVALEDKTIVTVLQSIREGIQKISDDIARKPEETEAAYVRSKVGLLPALSKDSDQVLALSIIDGTWQGTPENNKQDYVRRNLGSLPALSQAADRVIAFSIIDDTWVGTSAQRELYIDTFFSGVLDLAEAKTKLAAIPAGLSPADHQKEVNKRFDYVHPVVQRDSLIDIFFAGVLDLAEAKTKLAAIPSVPSPEARQTKVDERFNYVQSNLELFLLRVQKENFIVQKTAEVLQLEVPTASALLTSPPLPGVVANTLLQNINHPKLLDQTNGTYAKALNEISFPAIFTSLRLLHKDALMIGKLQMKANEVTWWLEGSHATDMGWMHPRDFPTIETTTITQKDIKQWVSIQKFFLWKGGLPKSDLTAFEFVSNVLDNTKTSATNITDLAHLTAWEADDINALAMAFHWVDPDPLAHFDTIKDQLKTSVNLVRLTDIMRALHRLGVNADRAINWVKAEATSDDAEGLKQTMKAKYDLTQWLQVITPLQDEFREQKRQALVTWLVAHPDQTLGQTWSDTNGLYSYFLIDVEMSACMLTSRLKQAAASAQLFVQRCLLHLEVDILASTDLDSRWQQWKWMKQYRVWEANRKVFLYPENWIEPELRDEKSPFFKDLESELMQNDVTNDTAEQAYLNYLEKLDKVANLEIRAIHNQQTASQDQPVLHVIGRSRSGLAPEYYYRKRINGAKGRWKAWEKVELDINANLIAPSIFNHRLYMFWPQFLEKALAPDNTSIPSLSQSHVPIDQPKKYWEIRLFWSELKKGKWTPKVLSDKFVTLLQNDASYQDLALRLTNTPIIGNIGVQLFASRSAEKIAPDNRFDFNVIGPQIDSVSHEGKVSKVGDELNGTSTETTSREILRVAMNSQVRDGLIMNNTNDVYYNYSFWDFTSEKSVVTTTTTTQPRVFSKGQFIFTVQASDRPYRTKLLIEEGSSIEITATLFDSNISLTYDHNIGGSTFGPEGSGKADSSFPLPAAPMYALLAKVGGTFYEIGASKQFSAKSEGELMFQFNDKGPFGDEGGSAWVKAIVTSPTSSKASSPIATTSVTSVEGPPPPAADSFGSLLLLKSGLPHSFIVVDSYNRSFDPAVNDQFFFWDKYRTYFVDYLGSPQGSYIAAPPQSSYSPVALDSPLTFRFYVHYHPFVGLFIKELNIRGLKGLLNRKIQVAPASIPGSPTLFDFADYQPTNNITKNYQLSDMRYSFPTEDVDFTYSGAYAPYNWELFFHVPLFIANKLSANQRFEEALEWFHYIFDPTSIDDTTANPDTPQQKFWITKPFYQTTKADYYKQKIENIMLAVAKGDVELRAQVEEWRENPFKPHLIARMRTVAYQKNVLIKYIQTLIAWGDQIFRRDTIESLNEATQLYILADSILGRRPKSIPKKVANPIKTFYQLQQEGIDDFGNALIEVENLLPTVSSAINSDFRDDGPELPHLNVLYFCIPNNEKLLTLWDTVSDRLFKIRHCMNIEGVVRQLPLFEPPIDPALLVKAAAAGLDIGAVLNDMSAPMPLYRFTFMFQRALDICNEVKSLGSAMLAALEKKDAEGFTILRSSHERMMLGQVRLVKDKQIDDALRTWEGLQESRKVIEERKTYYQKLINDGWSTGENIAFDLSTASTVIDAAIALGYVVSGGLKLIPAFLAGVSGFGGSPTVNATMGGEQIGNSSEMAARTLQAIATALDKGASLASTVASYERRAADWDFQKRLAEKELPQIDKQITAADIRHQIAVQDLTNQDKQIENAQSEDEYMRTKFTNQELCDWNVSQISTVYFQSYQLAYDLAKRAERCFRYELGLSDSNYIQFGYWDSLKKGLLCGDKLCYDLKRLETAYYEQNRREYELTKHISLAQLDPIALVKLRQNGECFVDIPETVFDMDYPGHYFRRLKTVGLSIPCVAGPYSTVACTLTLTSNHLRKIPTPANPYTRDLTIDDPRFRDEVAAIQSIATSNGQNDHGMFELNFRDERYLPFEGAGAISSWHIKLNKDFRQFDFSTISDVIIHLNYTAREGGELLRAKAVADVKTKMKDLALAEDRRGLYRVFDLKREYSAKWSKFLYPATPNDDQELLLNDLQDRLPYFTRSFATKQVRQVEVIALMKDPAAKYKVMLSPPLGSAETDLLPLSPASTTYQGLHRAWIDLTGSEKNFDAWTLKVKLDGAKDFKSLPPDAVEELFLIANYYGTIA